MADIGWKNYDGQLELSSNAFKKPRYIAGFFIYNRTTIDGKYVLLTPVDFISVNVRIQYSKAA